ncbi:MAG: Dabb family protein [Candidatus Nitrosocosmicus sp.]
MSFVKHIEGRFKEEKREEAIKKIVEFYNGLSGKIKGFNGFIMSGSLEDAQKAVNISIWETREDMDDYYANNKEYSAFLESLQPLIEQVSDNKDYRVFGFDINM